MREMQRIRVGMQGMGWEWDAKNQHGSVGNLGGKMKNLGNQVGDAGNQGGNLSIAVA